MMVIIVQIGATAVGIYVYKLVVKLLVTYLICKTPKLSESKVENIVKMFLNDH